MARRSTQTLEGAGSGPAGQGFDYPLATLPNGADIREGRKDDRPLDYASARSQLAVVLGQRFWPSGIHFVLERAALRLRSAKGYGPSTARSPPAASPRGCAHDDERSPRSRRDRVSEADRAALRAKHPDAILLSAKSLEDVATLRETIITFFEAAMVDDQIVLPYAKLVPRPPPIAITLEGVRPASA
jgi:hypothetical protein